MYTRELKRKIKTDELMHKWKRLVVEGQTWAIVRDADNSILGRTPPIPEREGAITSKIQHTLGLAVGDGLARSFANVNECTTSCCQTRTAGARGLRGRPDGQTWGNANTLPRLHRKDVA